MNLLPQSKTTALTGGISRRNATSAPLITITISSLLLAIGLLFPIESTLKYLCFDFYGITERGELWRLLTGHLVHSSWDHLIWDLIALTGCMYYVETRIQKALIPTLLLSITGLNLFLLSPFTSIEYYSGISGVLYSLLILSCWHWFKTNKGVLAWFPLLIVLGKTLLELIAAKNVFVTQGWQLFHQAHLIGIVIGVIIISYREIRMGGDTYKNSNA